MTEDLKTRILQASLELMNDGDPSALSMRAVARCAGVSHQAPYHYFEDREAILAELVRQGFEKLAKALKAAEDSTTSPRERVAALGRGYIGFALENASLFRLMFRKDMVDVRCHQPAQIVADEAYDITTRVLATAHAGTGMPIDVSVVGFWSLAHGFAFLALEQKFDEMLEEQNSTLDDLIDQVVRVFTANLPD